MSIRRLCPASEFDAEIGLRNEPTLASSWGDLRGVVSERERSSSAAACAVAGDEAGDLLGGDLAYGDDPGRLGPQVACRCVHDHRRPARTGVVKDAALDPRWPLGRGRPAKERNWELERARCEVDQLPEAVKSQASSSWRWLRGKAGLWNPNPERALCPQAPRLSAQAKEPDRWAGRRRGARRRLAPLGVLGAGRLCMIVRTAGERRLRAHRHR